MKKCPFCAEEIQDDAVFCKHCKSNLPKEEKAESSQLKTKGKPKTASAVWTILKVFGIIIIIIAAINFWYIVLPALAIWYIWKKLKWNKKKKIIATSVIVAIPIVILIIGMISAFYGKKIPVNITITEPRDGYSVQGGEVAIKGTFEPKNAKIKINGKEEKIDLQGNNFSYQAKLPNEKNTFIFEVNNIYKKASASITIHRIFTAEELAEIERQKAEAEAKKQAAQQEATKKEEEKKQAEREKVKTYYQQAMDNGKVGDDTYNAVLSHLENGTLFSSYEAVVTAINNMQVVKFKFLEEKDKISLNNKEQEQILKEAYAILSQEYESMEIGMEELKNYLDKDELKYLHSAKGFFSDAQNYQLSGVAKLVSVMNYYNLLDEITK